MHLPETYVLTPETGESLRSMFQALSGLRREERDLNASGLISDESIAYQGVLRDLINLKRGEIVIALANLPAVQVTDNALPF